MTEITDAQTDEMRFVVENQALIQAAPPAFLELVRAYAGALQRQPGSPLHLSTLREVLDYVIGLRAELNTSHAALRVVWEMADLIDHDWTCVTTNAGAVCDCKRAKLFALLREALQPPVAADRAL